MKIYVASSWRNALQPAVVKVLKKAGHEVYDFRDPDMSHFHWRDIDPEWHSWFSGQAVEALDHRLCAEGFKRDFKAMKWADICIMVTPCGKSASLEAGYFAGKGKKMFILQGDGDPELMFKLADKIFCNITDMLKFVNNLSA